MMPADQERPADERHRGQWPRVHHNGARFKNLVNSAADGAGSIVRHNPVTPVLLPSLADARLLDTLLDSIGHVARSDYVSATLSDTLARMRPGWVVLQGCSLGPDGATPPAQVQYVLLHQQAGIALLDLIPGTTVPNAAERLGRMLDEAGFGAMFDRRPPIVYLCIPIRMLPNFGWMLDQEFGQHPPLALPGSGVWVDVAQRMLAAERLLHLPERVAVSRRAGSEDPMPVVPQKQTASRRRRDLGIRLLAGVWGLLALAFGGGVAILHYLGPPEELTIAAAGSAIVDGPSHTSNLNTASEALPATGVEDYLTGMWHLLPQPISSPSLTELFPMPLSADLVSEGPDDAEAIWLPLGLDAPKLTDAVPTGVQGGVPVAVALEAPDLSFIPAKEFLAPPPSGNIGPRVADIYVPSMPTQDSLPAAGNTGDEGTQAQALSASVLAPDISGLVMPEQAEGTSRAGFTSLPVDGDDASSPSSSDPPIPTTAPLPPRSGTMVEEVDSTVTPHDIAATTSSDTASAEVEPPAAAMDAFEESAAATGQHPGALFNTAPARVVVAPGLVTDAFGTRPGSVHAALTPEAMGFDSPSAEDTHSQNASPAASDDLRAFTGRDTNNARENQVALVPEDNARVATSLPTTPLLATASSTVQTAVGSPSTPGEVSFTTEKLGTVIPDLHRPLVERDEVSSDTQQSSEMLERNATLNTRALDATLQAFTGSASRDRTSSEAASPVSDQQGNRPLYSPASAAAVAPVETRTMPAAQHLPPSMLQTLIKRGDEMIRIGDISAARLLYERAAVAGNGQAAIAMGWTYDPMFLAKFRTRGIQGDLAVAVSWYRRALALGVGEAGERLAQLGVRQGD